MVSTTTASATETSGFLDRSVEQFLFLRGQVPDEELVQVLHRLDPVDDLSKRRAGEPAGCLAELSDTFVSRSQNISLRRFSGPLRAIVHLRLKAARFPRRRVDDPAGSDVDLRAHRASTDVFHRMGGGLIGRRHRYEGLCRA